MDTESVDAQDAREAARLLRLTLAELPPQNPADTAQARRIEGAAIGLEALARSTNDRN